MIKNNKHFPYFPETSLYTEEIIERGADYFTEKYSVEDLTDFINRSFQNEYASYIKAGKFYVGCDLKTYKKFYSSRLKEFLSSRHGLDEFDFIQNELTTIKKLGFHEEYYNFHPELYTRPYRQNLKVSCKLVRDFLYSKVLDELNGSIALSGEFYEIYHLDQTPQEIKDMSFWSFEVRRPKKEGILNNETAQTPILPDTEPQAHNKLSALETAYLVYYLVESKMYFFINGTPGELDWKYFSEMTNGTNPDNIRKSYSEIIKPDKRLKASRTEKIKKVVSYLRNHFPGHNNTIGLADKELQLIENKCF